LAKPDRSDDYLSSGVRARERGGGIRERIDVGAADRDRGRAI